MNFDISGAAIYLRIPTGIPVLGDFVITETMVVSWLVMILITGFCIWLTRDLRVENISKRQAVAEMLVEQATNLVRNNTGGKKFDYLIPFVAALFTTSAVSNLISLTGLRSPTADLSVEAAWAVVVFVMITANKIKASGLLGYMKGFTTPIPVMTPFNILSEIATPISMACRHFGNILSGVVINGLLYAALAVASSALLGWLPGGLGIVTIVSCAIFAALTGSGPATVAAIGRIMIPSLVKNGYPIKPAAGMAAAGGALGPIIPPSIPMIIYGVTMSVSIPKMFVAGIVPGVTLMLLLIGVNAVIAVRNPEILKYKGEKFSFREFLKNTWSALGALLLPIIILG